MRFRADHTFEPKLRQTPEFKGAMAVRAVLLAHRVEEVALPHRDTGEYMGAVDALDNRVVVVRHKWHFTEYGTIHMAPQANVRRAAISLGMRFVDDRSADAESKAPDIN